MIQTPNTAPSPATKCNRIQRSTFVRKTDLAGENPSDQSASRSL
jgi:hypothetical protein